MGSDTHRSGEIAQSVVNLMRIENVADDEVWRDRPSISHDEAVPFDRAVVVRIGSEEIVQHLSPNLVDVRLTLEIECIARGDPIAKLSAGDPASMRVGDLRRAVTRVMLGDTLVHPSSPLDLSYVIDVDEVGSSAMSIDEGAQWCLGSQTMTWHILYRRSRVDPAPPTD